MIKRTRLKRAVYKELLNLLLAQQTLCYADLSLGLYSNVLIWSLKNKLNKRQVALRSFFYPENFLKTALRLYRLKRTNNAI